MNRNQFLVITLITILLFLQGATAIPCEDKRCTLEISEAIAIADSIVSGGTTRPTDWNLTTAKKFSTPWNEIVPRDSTGTHHSTLLSKLEVARLLPITPIRIGRRHRSLH